jgi:UDP-3-O-[3-hydroxymyristoyl] glucosamine N-acyltransferase
MPLTLLELASAISATVRGDGSVPVQGCAGLEDAGEHDVSFLANRKYVRLVADSKAAAVIVSAQDADAIAGRNLLVADDPYFAFRQAVVALHGFRQHPPAGVSERACIDPSAQIGEGCCIQPFVHIAAGARVGRRCVIYPHCYIGPDAVVGDDCLLYPNVTVYDRCVLGNRVTLHAGCVIGQDGFGYATHQGRHEKIPQIGNVVIGDDVEMGANCAIDRATVGSTVIGAGTKFSDLVAIGHGAEIGEHNLLVAQVGIAGSTTTGRYVVMGGQVGVAGHLMIGDMVRIAAKAGVMDDLPGHEEYGGQPALPMNQAKRAVLTLMRMPDVARDIKQMRRRIDQLEAELRRQSGDDQR